MATTPNLGMPVTAPEEVNKTFLEFRNDIYQSMITIDEALGDLRDGHGAAGGQAGTTVQADYAQNDQTAPDYIKNRPFYSIQDGFEWDGNVSGKTDLASSNLSLFLYNDVIAPKLLDEMDSYPYIYMYISRHIDYEDIDDPYICLLCCNKPFVHGTSNGEWESERFYSTDCTIVTYGWSNVFSESWVYLNTASYPNEDDTYFNLIGGINWSNVSILTESGSVRNSYSDPDEVLGENINFFKVSDEVMTVEQLKNTMLTIATHDEQITLPAIQCFIFKSSNGNQQQYILGPYDNLVVLASNVPGNILFRRYRGEALAKVNDYLPVIVPESGTYFAKISKPDLNGFVKYLAHEEIQKVPFQFLPFHVVNSADYMNIDMSQFKEGDVIFLIGDVTL